MSKAQSRAPKNEATLEDLESIPTVREEADAHTNKLPASTVPDSLRGKAQSQMPSQFKSSRPRQAGQKSALKKAASRLPSQKFPQSKAVRYKGKIGSADA